MGLLQPRRWHLGADALPLGSTGRRTPGFLRKEAVFAESHSPTTSARRNASHDVLAEARDAGAKITKPAERTPWGGFSGSFADPEGNVWEVATGAAKLPFSE